MTAILFIFSYIRCGITLDLLAFIVFFSLLLIISFIDLENMFIPDYLVIAGIAVGVLYSFLTGKIGDSLTGICFSFLFMYSISVAAKYSYKKEALGEGDIKLAVMISSFLGLYKIFIAIFAASMIGAAVGIILIMIGRLKKDDYIPFGPFMAIGALVALMI